MCNQQTGKDESCTWMHGCLCVKELIRLIIHTRPCNQSSLILVNKPSRVSVHSDSIWLEYLEIESLKRLNCFYLLVKQWHITSGFLVFILLPWASGFRLLKQPFSEHNDYLFNHILSERKNFLFREGLDQKALKSPTGILRKCFKFHQSNVKPGFQQNTTTALMSVSFVCLFV